MLRSIIAQVTRRAAMRCAFFLPLERRRRLDRWLRGREQFRKLRAADVVVVSHGKSGRTWLRVMLSAFYRSAYGVPREILLGFDNLHRADPRIPKIFFTHDNYLRDYTGSGTSKRDFYGKKVILLVRQPQDVVVSEYFNWKHRMKPDKMYLNDFPPRGEEVSLFEFTMQPCGLSRVLGFMNEWAQEIPKVESLLVVRYEDMRADPEAALHRIVGFLGAPDSGAAIEEAVEYASVENMRQMEQRAASRWGGGRLKPGDPSNPDSFKVRRARVGGYRDYYEAAELVRLDARVEAELAPLFGYARAAGDDGRAIG